MHRFSILKPIIANSSLYSQQSNFTIFKLSICSPKEQEFSSDKQHFVRRGSVLLIISCTFLQRYTDSISAVLLNVRHESADCVLRDSRRILGAACVTRWGGEPGDTPRHLDSFPASLSLSDRPSEPSCAFSKPRASTFPLTPITQPRSLACLSAHNTVIDYLHIGRCTEWRECISLSM